MSISALEKLLMFTKMIVVQRGKIFYRVGDRPDGVYLIKEGAFELTAPAPISQHEEDNVNRYNIDPMAKFSLKKQTKIIQDKSRATIKYAILGKGDLFGLQECQYKPNNPKIPLRQHTVTCVQNDSKVIFINHAAFSDRVLSDINTEGDIKMDTIIKKHFYESRSYQQQHTIWDTKQHSQDGLSRPETQTESENRDKSPE